MDIKPIETFYNGYRFRSRLEARYAVFFDAAGIKYEYEPEGYYLPDGSMYLPDFYLPYVGGRAHVMDEKGLYVEVKGKLTEADYNKIRLFCGFDDYGYPLRSVLIVGQIPPCFEDRDALVDDYFWNCETIDGDWYHVEFYRNKNGEIGIYGWDNVDDFDGFKWFDKAYLTARQARFEHGENPFSKTPEKPDLRALAERLKNAGTHYGGDGG